MSRIKKTKSRAADRETKKKEWPVIVYFWTFGLAILGYTLSNIGLSGLPMRIIGQPGSLVGSPAL